jgi:hypothetical protein
MKKIFLLAVACIVSCNTFAQSDLRFGIEAGMNISRSTEATTSKLGYNVGVTLDYSITPNWYVDGALKLSLKPWQISSNQTFNNIGTNQAISQAWSRTAYNPHSLILPIHVGYRFNPSNSTNIFVGVGPYFGLGLYGKGTYRYKTIANAQEHNEQIDNVYTNNIEQMKRFEVGLSAKAGVELKSHYTFTIGYDLQANDFAKTGLVSQRSQVISFNLGYKF